MCACRDCFGAVSSLVFASALPLHLHTVLLWDLAKATHNFLQWGRYKGVCTSVCCCCCCTGEHLPLDQAEILRVGPQGHSFEARLYAENVHRNFLPGVQTWLAG